MSHDLSHVRFQGVEPSARTVRGCPRAAIRVVPGPGDAQVPRGQLGPLCRRVLEHEGLDPAAYRAPTLQRRVAACLRALKVHSEQEALALLEATPGLWEAASDALLIGVTTFFRDPAVFGVIESVVLPDLARRDRIRAWSAGCSTGAELFSLAILLDQAGLLERAELLGTDCRPTAVKHAESGRLWPADAAEIDPATRARYVETRGGELRMARSLTSRMRWKAANLLAAVEEGPWDIVLWRNAAMYLHGGASDATYGRITAAIRPGGYLVVGKAERPPANLPLSAVGRSIYRKRGV